MNQMKTLLIMINLFMFSNLNLNLMLIMNYFYLNIFLSPLKQLMYLIFYIIFMSMNIFMLKQNISLNVFILLIIFISGILIMFSYFICLINKMSKKNIYLKLSLLNLLIFLSMIMQFKQIKFIIKNYNFNFMKNNKLNIMKKLYFKPNYFILFLLIIFLIFMLMVMTKICFIKNKNLRAKKWKK
uniref:NADH dehydrogenase subunit 6 n=1 Tax=Bombus lapidarius TaxID=30192 RepID=A0A0S2LTC6_BOMLA|nr:NADH dehydrogenase subunit 6 [Bombus lapidarius]